MGKKTGNELTDETVKLYDQGMNSKEIAVRLETPEYLIENILIQARDVCFR